LKLGPSFALLIASLVLAAPLYARPSGFIDSFDNRNIHFDPKARAGWIWLTGDGEAEVEFVQGQGFGIMTVDASSDRRGIWWAIIKRSISGFIDQKALTRADRELRIEARVRAQTAPHRINMSVNHSRTTDFHVNLAEFDLPDTEWHVVSFTTDGFDAGMEDEVYVQLAMIDWGIGRYAVEVDYIKAEVVDPRKAGPDLGSPLPYRPELPPPGNYPHALPVLEDAVVDSAYPWVNLRSWADMSAGDGAPALSVSGSQTILLRWDLAAFRGREPAGWGLLELTTESVQWAATELEEFGYLRAAEVFGGDSAWTRDTVTLDSFLAGRPRGEVIGQMFMDQAPAFQRDGKTLIGVSPPVLKRLFSGETKGIAIYAQGALNATFRSSRSSDPAKRPKLHFSVK
jgi:hypothetical protein